MKLAVIGAGYGDEGKGKMVDFFCEGATNPLVVRYNGGPQAGHTVMRDGKRHVFSSFGSGSLQGVPTFFDSETLVSPEAIDMERGCLDSPVLYVHPNAKLITPFDIAWNHYSAVRRGSTDTCGMGIYATICRHKDIPLCATDFQNISNYFSRLQEYYLNKVISSEDNPFKDTFMATLANAARTFWPKFAGSTPLSISDFPKGFDDIIFEGAQGLLLDEKYGDMPYCTPSNTGQENIRHYGLDEVVYVTRAYSTRHGDGPLERECTREDLGITDVDSTNVHNEFQGTLRYAPLGIDKILAAVYADTFDKEFKLAITCLDEVDYIYSIESGNMYKDTFIDLYGFDYISYGPTAEQTQCV